MHLGRGTSKYSAIVLIDPNMSQSNTRSSSFSSWNDVPSNRADLTVRSSPTTEEEVLTATFSDDGDNVSDVPAPSRVAPPRALRVKVDGARPEYHINGAFCDFALPTDLTIYERTSVSCATKRTVYPEHSPARRLRTGLSNMAKQHLRDSPTASSAYDAAPWNNELDTLSI